MKLNYIHNKNETFNLTLYTISDSLISDEKLYFFSIKTTSSEVDLLKEIYNLFDAKYDLILEDVSNIEDIRNCLSKEVLEQFKLPTIDSEKIDDEILDDDNITPPIMGNHDARPINGTTPATVEYTGIFDCENPPPINNQCGSW